MTCFQASLLDGKLQKYLELDHSCIVELDHSCIVELVHLESYDHLYLLPQA